MKKKEFDIDDMTSEEKEAYVKLQKKFKLIPKKEQIEKHVRKAHHKPDNVITHTLGIVKQPLYTKTFLTIFISFGILYSFLYGLWKIPVIEFGFNRFSAIGILDYAYILLISTFTGLIFSLMKYEKNKRVNLDSKLAGGGGALAGIVSAMCPVCQGITITALGSTVTTLPLAFLIPYIGLLQLMTVLILGFALYLKANSVFTQTCITCKIDSQRNN